jgi:hypothetical protein
MNVETSMLTMSYLGILFAETLHVVIESMTQPGITHSDGCTICSESHSKHIQQHMNLSGIMSEDILANVAIVLAFSCLITTTHSAASLPYTKRL